MLPFWTREPDEAGCASAVVGAGACTQSGVSVYVSFSPCALWWAHTCFLGALIFVWEVLAPVLLPLMGFNTPQTMCGETSDQSKVLWMIIWVQGRLPDCGASMLT